MFNRFGTKRVFWGSSAVMASLIGWVVREFPSWSTFGSTACLFVGFNFVDYFNDRVATALQDAMARRAA